MKDKALYKCDPNKNKQCRKTRCKYNPNAINNTCEHTKYKEYSVDGVPIVPPISSLY